MADVVTEVWRYPAKSMQGESLPHSTIGTNGITGDRGWAVRDEQRGGIRGAKKIGELMQLAVRYRGEPTEGPPPAAIDITLPDGNSVASDGADVDARLSAALHHPVTLWPLLPADSLDHYRRGAGDTDDLDAELRAIFGREPDEPLPDLSVFPPEIIEYESPLGTYFDAYPILIVTRQSLERLQEIAPGSRIDVRRFRPNIVVDAPDATERWPELAWVGRSIRVGSVTLDVVTGCPRCVMITLPFDDLPEDPRVMRAVVRDANQIIGVYATVRSPGSVAVGDALITDA
ncbi:MAG: MOSC domain-containing protein [Acidimicrobiia bacterium]